MDKFETDYKRRVMFSNFPNENANEIPDLYLPNLDFTPDEPNNPELSSRLNNFLFAIRMLFSEHKNVHSSLMHHQLASLQWLLDHPEIIVLNSDKNLGPAVIERSRYVELAWKDHLHDRNTYQVLLKPKALRKLLAIRSKIYIFTEVFCSVSIEDKEFIIRSLNSIKNGSGFAFMYLTAKIHKPPLKTRAIVSYSGSICHGIALWVDFILKKILKHMKYVARSSKDVVNELKSRNWNQNCFLFSADAVSLYTNIHFGHAKAEILYFLEEEDKGINIVEMECIPVNALIRGLEIVMSNNVFQFGDTYWLQTAGTAMGGPPAPSYAMLYYGIHEERIIPKFEELEYYTRYIDDTFNIWKPPNNEKAVNKNRIKEFMKEMNSYGTNHPFFIENPSLKPLQWTITDICKKVAFLDLDITFTDQKFHTKIFEKDLNLHLYIPPHSCHSPGVLKGFIFGSIHRAKNLHSNPKDIPSFIKKTYYRLRHRGHSSNSLLPIFSSAMSSILGGIKSKTPIRHNPTLDTKPLYLQPPYNPSDPPRQHLQKAFKDSILQPINQQHLSKIRTNNLHDGPADFDRLQICYTKGKSLGNILSPRKLRLGDFSIKKFTEQFD